MKTFQAAEVKPPCVKYFLDKQKEIAWLVPERGMLYDDIESAAKAYQNNIKKWTQKVLWGFNHVRWIKDWKVFDDVIYKWRKFFSEKEILNYLNK